MALLPFGSAPGANKYLSNLNTTSINQSLTPNATDTFLLGNATNAWLSLYVGTIFGDQGSTQPSIAMNGSGGGSHRHADLIDSTGVVSLRWSGTSGSSRFLFDSSGVSSAGWSTRLLQDTTGNASIDWGNRHLIYTDGSTISFDWSTASGTTGGFLNASTNLISNVVDPVSPQDAVTLHYLTTNFQPIISPLTAGGVLYTNGTAVANVGAGTSGQFLVSNGASAPTWTSVSPGTPIAPTIQAFTSGSGTYTPTSGSILYIKVTMIGGGGGGQGNAGSGGNGGNTTFHDWTAGGGSGATAGVIGGNGGTNTAGTGTPLINLAGAPGGTGQNLPSESGSSGGSSPFGGAGAGNLTSGGAQINAVSNSGSGGGGTGSLAGGSGGGGGSGGYLQFIANTVSSFSYSIGTAGTGGTSLGGNGGSGYILVEEFYQ